MLVIGLTGTKAGGKGEVSEFLKQQGFIYYSLSDIVREETRRRGIENYTVKDLQDIGNDLRTKGGLGVLAKMIIEKVRKDTEEGKDRFIIDGIRNPGEVEELKKIEGFNFNLLAVDAPLEKRFEWINKRGRTTDMKKWEDFLKMDARDKGDGELKIGQQVHQCMATANFKIMNDSTIAALHEKVKEILDSI